jgi:hypothetical protein
MRKGTIEGQHSLSKHWPQGQKGEKMDKKANPINLFEGWIWWGDSLVYHPQHTVDNWFKSITKIVNFPVCITRPMVQRDGELFKKTKWNDAASYMWAPLGPRLALCPLGHDKSQAMLVPGIEHGTSCLVASVYRLPTMTPFWNV